LNGNHREPDGAQGPPIDGQALLHPTILNSITDAAVARMKECLHHERVVSQERKLRPALTSREVTFWE